MHLTIIAANVQFICRYWGQPHILLNVKGLSK